MGFWADHMVLGVLILFSIPIVMFGGACLMEWLEERRYISTKGVNRNGYGSHGSRGSRSSCGSYGSCGSRSSRGSREDGCRLRVKCRFWQFHPYFFSRERREFIVKWKKMIFTRKSSAFREVLLLILRVRCPKTLFTMKKHFYGGVIYGWI